MKKDAADAIMTPEKVPYWHTIQNRRANYLPDGEIFLTVNNLSLLSSLNLLGQYSDVNFFGDNSLDSISGLPTIDTLATHATLNVRQVAYMIIETKCIERPLIHFEMKANVMKWEAASRLTTIYIFWWGKKFLIISRWRDSRESDKNLPMLEVVKALYWKSDLPPMPRKNRHDRAVKELNDVEQYTLDT